MAVHLKTLVGIFQSAHYDIHLFNSWVKRHPTPKEWASFSGSATVRWSLKARLLFYTARLLSLGQASNFPLALILAQTLLRPFEGVATWWLCRRAKRSVRKNGVQTIIGITGSYGKTTTKEIITAVLSRKWRVYSTPENVNTLLGVANWITSRDFEKDDILVVEMGAYHRGDIARLCQMIKPNIGIITGINEAHLERFGTIERTKAAKSEIFDSLPAFRGRGFWNQSSSLAAEAVAEGTSRWTKKGLTLIPYTTSGTAAIRLTLTENDETSLSVQIYKKADSRWPIQARVALLGRHHGAPLAVAAALADELGLSPEEIRRGLESVKPLPRRLAPIGGRRERLVIDDSYNITLDGLAAALEFLRPLRRRKIGIFAGIPEGGDKSSAINRELGRRIAEVFSIILLKKTPVEDFILSGLGDGGFKKERLIRYTDDRELEPLLTNTVKGDDCVYFSAYSWPAIYL